MDGILFHDGIQCLRLKVQQDFGVPIVLLHHGELVFDKRPRRGAFKSLLRQDVNENLEKVNE
jgi:hypothetical protein